MEATDGDKSPGVAAKRRPDMSGRSSWAPPVSGSHHHLPAGMPDHSAVDRPRHQHGGTTGRRVRIAGGKGLDAPEAVIGKVPVEFRDRSGPTCQVDNGRPASSNTLRHLPALEGDAVQHTAAVVAEIQADDRCSKRQVSKRPLLIGTDVRKEYDTSSSAT